MSLDSSQTSVLSPAVSALGATVECYTRIPGGRMDEFYLTVREAVVARAATFTYENTEFTMELDANNKVKALFVSTPLGEKLPKVFADNLLPMSFIIVRCPVPATLLAHPGWYVGLNHGFAEGCCMVDPTGELSGEEHIYANGAAGDDLDNQQLFDAVTGLFAAVMGGEVVHNGDDTGTIIRQA